MEEYEIKVTYKRHGSNEESLLLKCSEHPIAYIVDTFVLKSVMKHEKPNLVSVYPLLKTIPRDSPGQNMPSNVELMEIHGISELKYEIDGIQFKIST